MRKLTGWCVTGISLWAVNCTSLSEGQERLPDDGRLNERVTLRADPSETLRQRMNSQASEINRKRNIEEFDRNLPATTPTPLRPRQLPNAPIDSSRHNVYTPFYPVVPPIPAANPAPVVVPATPSAPVVPAPPPAPTKD